MRPAVFPHAPNNHVFDSTPLDLTLSPAGRGTGRASRLHSLPQQPDAGRDHVGLAAAGPHLQDVFQVHGLQEMGVAVDPSSALRDGEHGDRPAVAAQELPGQRVDAQSGAVRLVQEVGDVRKRALARRQPALARRGQRDIVCLRASREASA